MKPGGTSWSTGRELARRRGLMCNDCFIFGDDVARKHVSNGYGRNVLMPICPRCIRKRRDRAVRDLKVPAGETVKGRRAP